MPKEVPEIRSAPKPLAPYSIVTEAGGLFFLSGQVGIDTSTGEREPDDFEAQCHRVMKNIGAILSELGLGYSDIVKTTVFLAGMGDYGLMNEIYGSYFDGEPPARSAIQAGALPAGFLVEIEVVAAR